MENNKNNLISISELSNTVKNITPAKSKEDYLYLETSELKKILLPITCMIRHKKLMISGRARQPVSHNNILFSGVSQKQTLWCY